MGPCRICSALAAVSGVATLVASLACNPAPGTCSIAVPDASITINVDFASEQSSTVVTEGACSKASCASPVDDAGCAVWRATQTGTQGDLCRVGIIDPADGGFLFEKAVVNQTACGFYEAQIIHF